MRKVLAVAVMVTLTACSLPKSDPAAEALATKAYQQFVAGEDAALEAEFEAGSRTPQMRQSMAQLRTIIPKGQPAAPRLVGFNSYAGTGGRALTLTHQYDYPDGAQVTTQTEMTKDRKAVGGWAIRGLSVNVHVAGVAAPSPHGPSPHRQRPTPKPEVA